MSQNSQPEHNRKLFQVERIAFFSDAIMAIAMTLLILEFKIPAVGKDKSWAQVRESYSSKLIIPLSALLISFFSIGRLWIKHHQLFEHIVNYSERLLLRNLRFLLFIMFLPLSTSFMLEENNPWFLRFFFYFFNMGCCYFSFFLLQYMVYHKKNHFSHPAAGALVNQDQLFLSIFIYWSMAILSLFSKKYFYLPIYLLLLPVLIRWIQRTRDWIGGKTKKRTAPELNKSTESSV